MEPYVPIAFLNDFLFCPRSIYFHRLCESFEKRLYEERPQIEGQTAHRALDTGTHSTRREILQGMEVYCEKYRLCGKIDRLNLRTGQLTERKKRLKQLYPGHVFQLYGQYFSLTEMGYEVNSLRIHSLEDNRVFPVPLPAEEPERLAAFERTVEAMSRYSLEAPFQPNPNKCANCNYNRMCDYGTL